MRFAKLRLTGIALLALALEGCAVYYPSARDAGVYYEPQRHARGSVMVVDPLVYPYWSLDYFYFSRHYHPRSIFVHRHDPWYYPYPGWYYGYRHRGLAGPVHYPWYRHRGHYGRYQPWRAGIAFGFASRRDARPHRVRQLDARLSALQTARSLEVRSQRPVRHRLPAGGRRTPTGASGPVRSVLRQGERRSRRLPERERRRNTPPPSGRGAGDIRAPRRMERDTSPTRTRRDSRRQRSAPGRDATRSRGGSRAGSPEERKH